MPVQSVKYGAVVVGLGAMGAAALVLTLSAEVAGAVWLRGLTVSGAFAEMRVPEGLLSLGLFAVFAVLPAISGDPKPAAGARE
jgi:hypothetical protein